jgi:hypothetical protein
MGDEVAFTQFTWGCCSTCKNAYCDGCTVESDVDDNLNAEIRDESVIVHCGLWDPGVEHD